VARAECRRANLAAVVAVAVSAVGGRVETVAYEKAARYDRQGHVGWAGLIAEALDSLTITGALPRLLAFAATGFGIAALATSGHPIARALLMGAAGAAAIVSLGTSRQARHRLAGVRAAGQARVARTRTRASYNSNCHRSCTRRRRRWRDPHSVICFWKRPRTGFGSALVRRSRHWLNSPSTSC